MKPIIRGRAAFLAIMIAMGGAARAQACEVDNWRWSQFTDEYVHVHGTTTCATGKLILRLFTKDDEYVGNSHDYFEGYAFEAYVEGRIPGNEARIRYTIEPR